MSKKIWQARGDSNPQPPVLETGALTNWSYWPASITINLSFFMNCVLTTKLTILLQFVFILVFTLVSCRCIIPTFTFITSEYDNFSWHNYSKIFDMTPAPTVCPPSRMAKRNSSSIAIGVSNSTVTVILSPGITISTPSGRRIVPVTSVVRR